MSTVERNPGLDVGRIMAMTLVILLHVTGSGMDGGERQITVRMAFWSLPVLVVLSVIGLGRYNLKTASL